MALAYCYASGQIAFGPKVPRGALEFLRGPESKLRAFVDPLARHAYDGETLLVPGIPEAPNQSAALAALRAWLDWIEPFAKAEDLEIFPRGRR